MLQARLVCDRPQKAGATKHLSLFVEIERVASPWACRARHCNKEFGEYAALLRQVERCQCVLRQRQAKNVLSAFSMTRGASSSGGGVGGGAGAAHTTVVKSTPTATATGNSGAAHPSVTSTPVPRAHPSLSLAAAI